MTHTDRSCTPKTTFSDWTNNREVPSLASNAGAPILPFQNWQKVKEAFAPELIARAISESPLPVQRCIDPFGGSGTTGLACQFLGVHPILGEVNPYLADLIEAKLYPYDSLAALNSDLETTVEMATATAPDNFQERYECAPRTMVEPGLNGKWIFDEGVARRIAALQNSIHQLDDPIRRRLFRVILGGILVQISNVTISGKGRRYRKHWRHRRVSDEQVLERFMESGQNAIRDIERFRNRKVKTYEILRGDSRTTLNDAEQCDLVVSSPPYVNSADYTDVYNLELWILGYLSCPDANFDLRSATVSSHLQVAREFAPSPTGSKTLREVLIQLQSERDALWDRRIPEMVGTYFSDLLCVFRHLNRILVDQGTAWIVVSDSRYRGIQIPVAMVLEELVKGRGWRILGREPVRTIATSAQQGGKKQLFEQLLILQKI